MSEKIEFEKRSEHYIENKGKVKKFIVESHYQEEGETLVQIIENSLKTEAEKMVQNSSKKK